MISKHVDLVAVGLVLFGMALVSHAEHFAFFTIQPRHRIVVYDRSGSPRVIVPPLPPIPYTRD